MMESGRSRSRRETLLHVRGRCLARACRPSPVISPQPDRANTGASPRPQLSAQLGLPPSPHTTHHSLTPNHLPTLLPSPPNAHPNAPLPLPRARVQEPSPVRLLGLGQTQPPLKLDALERAHQGPARGGGTDRQGPARRGCSEWAGCFRLGRVRERERGRRRGRRGSVRAEGQGRGGGGKVGRLGEGKEEL